MGIGGIRGRGGEGRKGEGGGRGEDKRCLTTFPPTFD